VICVVALNPALDITYHVAGVDWSGVNRPAQVSARPGGKGLNVARTLLALVAFLSAAGDTRRTFTVVDTDRGCTTLFSEPGPAVTPEEYAAFGVTYEKSLVGCSAVVLSGSLPAGLAPGTYAALIAAAVTAGVPVVLDAHAEALRLGAAAGPAVVKPNLAELEAATGRGLSTPGGPELPAVAAAARQLAASGAGAVVATLGPAGAWAVAGGRAWRVTTVPGASGNPTGAGDAVTAGLALGLVLRRPWEELLRHAVALGTAAAAPVAGEFSDADYRRALGTVTVTRDRAR
jgi:1-phosphofructokinase family hexose kinase